MGATHSLEFSDPVGPAAIQIHRRASYMVQSTQNTLRPAKHEQLYKKQTSSHYFTQRKNVESGFVSISLIALAPLLLALFFTSSSLSQIVTHTTRLQTKCETRLYQHQAELASSLAKLMRLNPKARRLKTQHHSAKLRLYAAIARGNPVAITAAEARLMKVEIAIAGLKLEQESLLLDAKQTVARNQILFRNQLAKHSPQVHLKDLEVFKLEPTGVVTEYSLKPNYTQVQTSTLQMRWSHEYDKKWLEFPIRCAASIEQRGSEYRPSLAASTSL